VPGVESEHVREQGRRVGRDLRDRVALERALLERQKAPASESGRYEDEIPRVATGRAIRCRLFSDGYA
jgi:hypothetical protein